MMAFPVLFQSAKRRIWAIVFLIFILSAACLLYWCLFSPLQKGICIGDVKVGDLSPWKAREVLESAWEETLLKEAGIPVAVGNAKDEVKKIAKYVAPTNHEDGVADAIERFALVD